MGAWIGLGIGLLTGIGNGLGHRWPNLAGALRIESLFTTNKDCTNAMYNIENNLSSPACVNSDHFPPFL